MFLSKFDNIFWLIDEDCLQEVGDKGSQLRMLLDVILVVRFQFLL